MLRLTVVGEASTQMLLRVINLVAQRGLILQSLAVRSSPEVMTVRLVVNASEEEARIVIEKLRALVEVRRVTSHEMVEEGGT